MQLNVLKFDNIGRTPCVDVNTLLKNCET